MHYWIDFPNLGISFKNVGKMISIGNFEIAYYGIVIAIGILVGALIAFALAKHTGQKVSDYENLLILGIIFGIIGARAYYVIFSWDSYRGDIRSILNIREGGLAIYGGLIGAVLTAVVYTRIKKLSLLTVLDTVCIGFPAGQMIGRWGNFFNREAFGDYTDGLFAMRLPVDAVRSHEISEKMESHMVKAHGIDAVQVHPTFLYESAWCLLILIVLLVLGFVVKKRFKGQMVLTYFGLYGLGRFFIEGLRTDQLKIGSFAVSQILSGALAIGCLLAILIVKANWRKR